MRIMAVCLLRIGDILMCAPALRALKMERPGAQLHVMINAEFKFCRTFMPYVDQFHCFPRRELQENLGDPQDPVLNSFDVLRDFIQNINQLKFDVVYNFTHNRLSGYLCGAIEAPEKVGMYGSDPAKLIIEGHWFRYLNRPKDDVKLHFSEIFQRAVGSEGIQNIVLAEDPSAASWAAETFRAFGENQRVFGLQCFSNEKRKQLPVNFWSELLSHDAFAAMKPLVLVLAAPWEESDADEIVDEMKSKGIPSRTVVCSFAQAFSLIKKLDALLTVDTSIKHLASATETPVIEFAIGGSIPHQTGVFSERALIFEVHDWEGFSSSDCVGRLVERCVRFLNHEETTLSLCLNGATAYRPVFVNHATWFLENLSVSEKSCVGDDLLRQALLIGEIRSLEGVEDTSLASSLAFSIADKMKNELHELKVSLSEERLKKMQDSTHSNLSSIRRANDNLSKVFSGRIHFLDWLEDYQSLPMSQVSEHESREASLFSPHDTVVDISELRRFQKKLDRNQIQENWNLKFLRTLQNHMTEKL